MPKTKLVCTAELELSDNTLEAARAQASLLEVWEQFGGAVPEGTVLTERVVKAKPKSGKGDDTATKQTGEIAGFLKR